MDPRREEVRDFLTSRRDRLTPGQAGLPMYGVNRRVKGLRRDEVAVLSGISTDYYTRLERGNLGGVSDQVLDALAAALQLDESERTHLFDLARLANARPGVGASRRGRKQGLRPGVRRIIDGFSGPAYVRNGRMDVLALNALGRALFHDAIGEHPEPGAGFNLARYLFLDDRAREFYTDWSTVARDSVAALRIEAGRSPYDRGLTDLVGELSTRSEDFRRRWAAHNVRLHATGVKLLHHPVVGDLDLPFETFPLGADDGQALLTYTAEPGSPSQDALNLLASWAADNGEIERPAPAGDPEPADPRDTPN